MKLETCQQYGHLTRRPPGQLLRKAFWALAGYHGADPGRAGGVINFFPPGNAMESTGKSCSCTKLLVDTIPRLICLDGCLWKQILDRCWRIITSTERAPSVKKKKTAWYDTAYRQSDLHLDNLSHKGSFTNVSALGKGTVRATIHHNNT